MVTNVEIVNVRLDSITIPKGRRPANKQVVASLADSIQEVGLINPITVTTDRVLVAGLHRIEAHRLLGKATIPAHVMTLDEVDRRRAAIHENLRRHELSALEHADQTLEDKKLYLSKHPETGQGKSPGNKGGTRGKAPIKNRDSRSLIPAYTADLASKTGVSRDTVEQDVKIASRLDPVVKEKLRGTSIADNKAELLRLARKPAPEQRAIAEKLASGEAKTVKGAKNATVAEQIKAEPPPLPKGPFRVIVIDPPWRYEKRAEDPSHRAVCPYPDMSVEEICAMPVTARAHEDCVLWLWTTNAFMRQAFQCLDAWGFQEKTILTWAKDRMGTGDWLRGRTEHCILAVRGKPTITLTNQTTLLEAPLREHSRKPDAFYDLVAALCPSPPDGRLDWFGREARLGFIVYGAEARKFDGPAT